VLSIIILRGSEEMKFNALFEVCLGQAEREGTMLFLRDWII
jgi:hypothetical protein